MSLAVNGHGYDELVAQRASLRPQANGFWHASAVACGALLVGGFMGYGSLAAGPLGMAAMVAAGALVWRASAWRSLALGLYVIGTGVVGAWLLLPALTNKDHAVTYPVGTGLVAFVIYAAAAGGGIALAAVSFLRRRG